MYYDIMYLFLVLRANCDTFLYALKIILIILNVSARALLRQATIALSPCWFYLN